MRMSIWLGAGAALFMISAVQAQEVLEPGVRYSFGPGDTQCYTDTSGKGGELLVTLTAACNNNTGRADIDIATGGSLKKLELDARVRFQKWVKIAEVPDVSDQSLIPVQVHIPTISWNINLFNDAILEFFGRGSADVVLTIRENPTAENPGPDNIAARGRIVAQQPLLTTSHGGIGGGCVVSTAAAILAADPFGLAASTFSCVAAAPNSIRQTGAADLLVMMRPGQIYNIEVELLGTASKTINPPENLNFITVRSSPGGLNEDPPGMQWNNMVIKVGTDPQALVVGLQEQIDELTEEVKELRYLLETHTHEYLTGKGNGHNNTLAETSTLLQENEPLPDDPEVPPNYDAEASASAGGAMATSADGSRGGGSAVFWLLWLLAPLLLLRRR